MHAAPTVSRFAFFAFFAFIGLTAMACQPALEANLLRLDSVGPEEIREGHALQIDGAGFEPGQRGILQLVGTYYRPGFEPQDVSQDFELRVLSTERARVVVNPAQLRALGGRGTFEGIARVSFHARATVATLLGRLENVRLDFHPAAIPHADRRDEAGAAAASAFGFRYAEGPLDEGLLITEVSGHAAAAGVRAGDHVVSFAHVRVGALSDFQVPPEFEELHIVVRRQGQRDPVVLASAGPGAHAETPWPWWPIAIGLLLLFLFGAPARLLGAWSWALREEWRARGLWAQAMVAFVVALTTLLHPELPVAVAVILAFASILVSGRPLMTAWHLAPGLLILLIAARGFEPGGASPLSWTMVQSPGALALLVVGVAAACSGQRAVDRKTWSDRLARFYRGSLLAALTTVLISHHLAVAPLAAFLLGLATPRLTPHLTRSGVLLAFAGFPILLQVVDFHTPPPTGLDVSVLPLALFVALVAAWISSRRAPLRLPVGL